MLRWVEEPRFNDVTANGLCGEFVAMRATQQVTTLEPLSDEKHFSSPEKSGGEEPAQEVSGEHYEQPSVALNPSGVMSPPPAAPFVPDPALAVADATSWRTACRGRGRRWRRSWRRRRSL